MGRILKLCGIVAGALVALFVVILVIIGFVFDPNDYKDQITTAVADSTGRTLELSGDLELQLFPRLRIAIGAASLSNADGFGEAPFAAIDGARLQLGLLPLLSGRVEIDEARLEGLRLNLARGAGGTNNWQDLSDEPSVAPTADEADDPAESAGGASLDLDVGAVEIADAEVSWSDATTDTEWLLTNFNLEAEGLGPESTFPLSIAFDFAGPEIDVSVNASMEATLALGDNAYRLDGLEVTIDGSGTAWPGGEGRATVGFSSFGANLDEQTVELNDLALEILGLEIAGTLSGQQLFDDLTLSGDISIGEFNPNDLLEVFDAEIETADSDAFTRASVRAEFIYDSTQMGMRNTEIVLDDSTLSGSIGMQGETLRFDLIVDAIDIDRYLPRAAEDTGDENAGSVDEVDLPLDPLKTFSADGNLAFGEARFMAMTFTDANFALTASDGRMRLTPTGAMYGGSIDGEISIVVEGDSARFGLVQTLENVDLHGLARDFLQSEDLSGTGNVNLDLTAVGSNVGAMRRDLDGTASFTLRDGAWEGLDTWYELRRARAITSSNETPEREGEPRTTFSNVSATGIVQDGILTTEDLNATLPFAAVNGSGTVNLLNDELDISASAGFVDGPMLQSDPAMAELAGASLPLTVGGTLGEPSILPDFGALLRAQVREEVDERVEEEREEVEERLRDRVRDRLRGLLD